MLSNMIQKAQLMLLFIYICIISTSSGAKLNVQSILLNYIYDLPTKFTIFVTETEECFDWYSENIHLVSVHPQYQPNLPECSRSAIVSSIGNGTSLQRTQVNAISKGDSRTKLVCDVFTDVPDSVELQSITDEITIHNFLKVSVVAKNKHGKLFDSVNGIQFHWNFTCSDNEKEILRIKKFSETNFSFPERNDDMEIRGLFSSHVLVQGLETGTCSLSATTTNFTKRKIAYQTLITPNIQISVLPDVRIFPSKNLNVLKNSVHTLEFKASENKQIEIVPDESAVSAAEAGIVTLSSDLTSFTAEELGNTDLIYKSHNNKFSDINVSVHVLEPDSLEIQLSRGGFLNLEEMKSYVLRVVMRSGSKRIIPSDNIRMKVKFPSKLFHLNSSTENGTYYVIQTLAPGSGTIVAEYKGHVLKDGTLAKVPSLTTSIKVRVCHKLQVYPPSIILPVTNVSHEVTLRVSGGTNHYSWGLNDSTVASIITQEDNNNVVKIRLDKKESDITVSATDINNINFIASAKISVQEINYIEVYPTVVEAEVGNTLLLPVALLGYECKDRKIIKKFDDCSKVHPTVEIINKHVLIQDENEPFIPAFGKGCLTLQFRCKSPGHSRINIYHTTNESEQNEMFKTTTVLSCYKPLRAVHPVRVAVLALGTSKEIAFEGGPRKWPLFVKGHETKLKASNPDLVDIELVPDPIRYNRDLTVFRVLCKGLGETVLAFTITNVPSATNPHPAKSEAAIMLVCNVPESIHLRLHKNSERAKKEAKNTVKVPFYGEKLFSVDIWLKDAVGRKFCNISSFNIEFELSDDSLVSANSLKGVTTYENAVSGYRKVSRDFKEFKMSGGTGDLTITAKIRGYDETILQKQYIKSQNLKDISNSIDLKLISLRDMNPSMYPDETEEQQDKENVCDGDSCKL